MVIYVILVGTTTVAMETTPKIALLEALSGMDNLQAQKVLAYVKSLPGTSDRASKDYRRFRKQAMSEIRLALKESRKH